MSGLLRVNRRRCVAFVAVTALVAVVGVAGMRHHLDAALAVMDTAAGAIDRIGFRSGPVRNTVLDEASPNPVPLREGQRRLSRIRETGLIRIGFNPDEMPFAFFNAQIVYPIAQRDLLFRGYVERWAILARADGTVSELYEHWILGRGATDNTPRWSIARDLLGWGK